MSLTEPAFTLGVEEEYLLVDLATRDLVSDPHEAFMQACVAKSGHHVSPELMRSQIEIGTSVCSGVKQATAEVKQLRQTIADVAADYGYGVIAASTHPFAKWNSQKQTERDRYRDLTQEMQAAARRLVICGMHVHVGIEDQELRIDLMNQLAYFLPHLLALSCSSPFWEGDDTGLKCYRLTIFDALPRTGLPAEFASYGEYERHIEILIKAGVIDEPSKIWWDLRPSARFPTLETRIMDVCTNINHAMSLVALTVCLLRMLFRLRRNNQRWRVYSTLLVNENRWRAMRYSSANGMIDFAKGDVVPFDELLAELVEFVREDAEALDCVDEIDSLKDILTVGTSAQRQVALHEQNLAEGQSSQQSLENVVDWLLAETVRDCR